MKFIAALRQTMVAVIDLALSLGMAALLLAAQAMIAPSHASPPAPEPLLPNWAAPTQPLRAPGLPSADHAAFTWPGHAMFARPGDASR